MNFKMATMECNDFSNSESLCDCDTMYLLSSFGSIRLMIWEEMPSWILERF